MSYMNSKGDQKFILFTAHAKDQFAARYNNLLRYLGEKGAHIYNREVFSTQNIADFNRGCAGYVCEKLFNTAKRIDGITKDQRKRDRKYPPYIRLRHVPFEFIIENCILKTVEICVKDFRHLNKVK